MNIFYINLPNLFKPHISFYTSSEELLFRMKLFHPLRRIFRVLIVTFILLITVIGVTILCMYFEDFFSNRSQFFYLLGYAASMIMFIYLSFFFMGVISRIIKIKTKYRFQINNGTRNITQNIKEDKLTDRDYYLLDESESLIGSFNIDTDNYNSFSKNNLREYLKSLCSRGNKIGFSQVFSYYDTNNMRKYFFLKFSTNLNRKIYKGKMKEVIYNENEDIIGFFNVCDESQKFDIELNLISDEAAKNLDEIFGLIIYSFLPLYYNFP